MIIPRPGPLFLEKVKITLTIVFMSILYDKETILNDPAPGNSVFGLCNLQDPRPWCQLCILHG